MLFWKWISDTWVYEHDEAVDEYGPGPGRSGGAVAAAAGDDLADPEGPGDVPARAGRVEVDIKFLPRYPQFEAALGIHRKVLDGRPGGLIRHHQGSGKTELMAFAAARLLRDPAVTEKFGGAPTVIVIADRKDLVRQTAEMFETAGMPRMTVPRNRRELFALLRSGEPGVIITTVHKFAEAGHLNDRSNIVVLVDEAHRSQEGKFGPRCRPRPGPSDVPPARPMTLSSPRPDEPDIQPTFRLHGIRFDYSVCLSAALTFLAEWPDHQPGPVTVGPLESAGPAPPALRSPLPRPEPRSPTARPAQAGSC